MFNETINKISLKLRLRDDLKAKAQQLAASQGVSLNCYINATLAATIAQAETIDLLSSRLGKRDLDAMHTQVLEFMSKSRRGAEPTANEIDSAIGDK